MLPVHETEVVPLLGTTYYFNIGRKLGAKVTIKFSPANDKTRYIVRTSLKDDELKGAAKTWVRNALGDPGGDNKDK
jgi:hypothetical protein